MCDNALSTRTEISKNLSLPWRFLNKQIFFMLQILKSNKNHLVNIPLKISRDTMSWVSYIKFWSIKKVNCVTEYWFFAIQLDFNKFARNNQELSVKMKNSTVWK